MLYNHVVYEIVIKHGPINVDLLFLNDQPKAERIVHCLHCLF